MRLPQEGGDEGCGTAAAMAAGGTLLLQLYRRSVQHGCGCVAGRATMMHRVGEDAGWGRGSSTVYTHMRMYLQDLLICCS